MHSPGGPERLMYEEVPTPQPARGQVLVRVHAVGITPRELFWPTSIAATHTHSAYIPGRDVSGVIEALGADVPALRVGEEVYGLIEAGREGACAEYVCMNVSELALKPQTLGHARAAAVPTAALAAWQALFDHAAIKP